MKKNVSLKKVDARLNLLLSKSLKDLERLKKVEIEARNKLQALFDVDIKAISSIKDEKKRKDVQREFYRKLDTVPTALTFGLHFPKSNPKKYAVHTSIKEPFVCAFIKATASVDDLTKLGVQVRNQSGNIFTCFIPLKLIEKLASMKGIEFIELSRPNRNNLGQAIPFAQINTLQAAPNNLTGAGVIVGVIDGSLDIYHPDFRNNDAAGGDGLGSSRVLFMWDQFLTPNAVESSPPVDPVLPGFTYAGGTSYGVEYTQANINSELNAFTPATPNAYGIARDVPGTGEHGTHVTGCATGNGRSGSPGAAPGADIIHVNLAAIEDSQLDYIHGDSTFLMDAFAYVFARASLLGRPCIANRSGSDNMGPHDGSTLGEQFLDNLLLTPNRVITLAAGNTNTQTETLIGSVVQGGTTAITINYNNATRNDEFEIWYDGHDRFDISLTIPTAVPTILNVAAGATGTTTLANGIIVTIVSVINDPRNGDNRITMFLENVTGGNTITNGNWVLTITGASVINGSFSSWLERNNRGARTLVGATVNNMSIATPATGLRIIAVGAHDDVAVVPVIAPFSSCGPTRDGRVKPDISTVGVSVSAARSINRNAVVGIPPLTTSMSGTSMSSPIIAGTCALIYECRGPGLSWFDMKQILQNNVGTPPVGIPSNQFGFGFLQIASGCTPIVNDVDVWVRDAADDAGIEPYAGAVAWQCPDIEVLDMTGAPVSNPTHNSANFVNNIIRVTARNRSASQVARNVEVYLYWADPGTSIAFPSDWSSTGIYTGTAPNFVNQTNKIIIPQIAAGASVSVDFAWAPPAPGSNVRGDDHFCLLARLEQESDPSNIGAGGWGIIRGSNNIGLRNTHVVEADSSGDADSAFYVTGTADIDTLEVHAENIQTPIKIIMPVQLLTWYDLNLAEKFGARKPYGTDCAKNDPLLDMRKVLKKDKIYRMTGIVGADLLEIIDGTATVHFMPEKGQKMHIPHLNIAAGAKVPVRVQLTKLKNSKKVALHIGQFSGGIRQTGVSIEVVKKLIKSNVRSVLLEGKKKLVIK